MASSTSFRASASLLAMLRIKKNSTQESNGSRSPQRRLLKFEDLPVWYQDNALVRSGYRPVSHSIPACLFSWSYLHNETLNIFTHLLPAILFLFALPLVQRTIRKNFPLATRVDEFIFTSNILAASTTLALSACYHTIMNHSYHVSLLWLRIDYVGILTLILGSFVSGIYVGFYCNPFLRNVYWTMIMIMSLVTSVLVMHPRLQGPKYRSYRTAAFVVTGLSGFAPVTHGLYLFGWAEMWVRSGMPYWFLEGIVYGLGAFFFASRVPESIWPGRFDICFSSHQIFHILVVAGAIIHLMGVWDSLRWHYLNNQSCVFG